MHGIGVGFFVGAGVPEDCTCDGEWSSVETHCGNKCCELHCLYCQANGRFPARDLNGCEFEQRQPREWYWMVHDVTKIAGTTEPIKCDHELADD